MAERMGDNFRERISSWSHLAELVEHFSYFNGHDWLFRGVTSAAYTLVPRIGREETRRLRQVPGMAERVRVPYRPEDERAVLNMFHQQARPHLQTPPQCELEWLAIA